MCLISMAVHDTVENKRSAYTNKTFQSLMDTVDFSRHRLFISDNNSCADTHLLYAWLHKYWRHRYGNTDNLTLIYNSENIGTAEAINKCWQNRRLSENAVKIDNDVVIHKSGWVDEMEAAISADSNIGAIGLKRKDLEQRPGHPTAQYNSELIMLPHMPGGKWIVVEKSNDIMGTCVMHSAALLEKVGYLYQPALYGFDDVIMSIRSKMAGFYNCFLPHIEIEHIDAGGDEYCTWKAKHSGEQWNEINQLISGYHNGKSIYYSPFNTQQ